ncbi:CRTAC1 family protein [Pararhodobacter sp. CCB-MM2]|uniref:CRTAC1 family protein n=1 Tax=Pararhodobacter sp. CCB-MM2 TaxID=1786003 RepID=UPI00082D96F8|nr:CRTAC1 family protein [Pararhodobacter sp. CCB-MM2]
MIWRLAPLLIAAPAWASPQFENLSATLPEHIYAGGWEHFVGGGVAVFDCDGDALPEILAAGGENPMLFLHNGGAMAFSPAEFPQITGATGAYPLDLDGDGLLDLYILRAGPDRVLRGGPSCQFTDETEAWGLPQDDRWTTAFTAWWEGDRPTLAIGHYVDRANPNGPFEACDTNTLLLPEGDHWRAEDLAPGFCALSMLAARDARDRPTLRISNDRHYYVRGGYEQMYDLLDHRFLTPEDGWQHVSLWGMGIASRDLNGDGRDEVMLTSMGDQLLQIAQSDGTYTAAPYAMGTYATLPHDGSDGRPSTGWHAQFGDVDNDGLPDLFIAKGNVDQMPTNAIHDPNDLLMQAPDGTFHQTATEAGIATRDRSRGAALADLDGDGRLDLMVVNRRAPLELYRNVTPDTGHWLGVALTQAGGNRFAIGARVTVTTNRGTQVQQVTVGGGHAGGQALPLHFGLGDTQTASIRVEWPDGQITDHEVEVDQSVTLTP